MSIDAFDEIFREIRQERHRQVAKFGEQLDVPDGTGSGHDHALADLARTDCERAFKQGRGSYRDILHEEVYEALAESDKTKLRAELLQVATVAIAWIAKLDREAA